MVELIILENVFKPLEMNRTCYTAEEMKNDPFQDSSTGYKVEDKKVTPVMHLHTKFLHGGGGILSSAHEMANYIRFVLQKGKFGGYELLNESTSALLWNPIIKSAYSYKGLGDYCLGWVKENRFGTTVLKHGGGLFSSTTSLSILPEKQIGVFAIENDMKGICAVVVDALLSLLTGNDPQDLPFFRFRKIVDKIEGTYQTYRGLYSLKIELKGPLLMAHLEIDDGDFDLPITILDPDNLIFAIPSGLPETQRKIKFIRDKKTNQVNHVILKDY